MGSSVGVLLTIYRQLLIVLLIPADSDLLLKPALIDSSTALWACLKITMDLIRIEPTPGFRFKFASSGGNTGVPLTSTTIFDKHTIIILNNCEMTDWIRLVPSFDQSLIQKSRKKCKFLLSSYNSPYLSHSSTASD